MKARGNMACMSIDDPVLRTARARVAGLQAWLQTSAEHPVRLIETHISWVLLADTLAFKIKKPVRLPFLDFTSLAARRHFCDEELRLNHRLAPSYYLDVVDIYDGPHGPRFGGDGSVVDVALRMRRFADGALWSERLAAGRLAPQHIDAMARRLHEFHRAAAVAPGDSGFGSAQLHERVTQALVEATDAWCGPSTAPAAAVAAWPALRAWLGDQLPALAPLWDARRRAGRVRECHGDLHLANVLQLGDEVTAFDAIEFDPALRWIDVLDDIAFLTMDLLAHRQRALAFRFVNAYLEAGGDYDGLPALRYFMVCRALVRAQVAALTSGLGADTAAHGAAANYLSLAVALSSGADPRLAITHGLPGSGKSFVSQSVIEFAGAIRVRSDVERKRLFGLAGSESSRGRVVGSIYDEATTRRTYARLFDAARVGLGAGWPVVVDAAFLRRPERAHFAALASALAVPFAVLDCRAPVPLLRERLAQRQARGGDASEADASVLERLRAGDEPLDEREAPLALVTDAAHALAPELLARRWLERR
jgi:aminoglycoside phosphotransferase family enzyme/predicted kinase